MELKIRMQRLIFAEKAAATNQCFAVFPWTAFRSTISPKVDIGGSPLTPILSYEYTA